MATEPKFGDVYQWVPGKQIVMVINNDPMAFIHLGSDYNEQGAVTAFESMNGKYPFTDIGEQTWKRIDA